MTPHSLHSLTDLKRIGADTIIDVRAPSEFAIDHVPGAINLPVLSDAERAEVGTIYTRQSAFTARKIGAALVARNAASHLSGPLADKDGGWQPLVYCWRGGQRSGSFATILDQVGWRVHLVKGGYQSYRRLVVEMLYDTPLPHRLTVIEGGTGTAKTRLLHHLRDAGAQVLDLEGLADHRGSIFGGMPGAQPSQKMFETEIAQALNDFDPACMTWVEAESSKVGARMIPPSLWSAMNDAPRIELRAPLAERATFLCEAYSDLTDDAAKLQKQIDKLRPYHAADLVGQWQEMARTGHWKSLAQSLISTHYDPRYAKSMARTERAPVTLDLQSLKDGALAKVAADLMQRIT